MPWTRPTLSELVARIETDLASRLLTSTSPLRRSVIAVLARVMAGAVHLLYGFLAWLAKQLFLDTCEAEFLVRKGGLYNKHRKAAAFASGPVSFSGASGATIPSGTQLQTADGVLYSTTADATIAAGIASAAATAAEAGAGGNLEAGAALSLLSPISGVQSQAVVGSGGITGGLDEEDDESLRARTIERVQEPPHGGAAHDYVAWAKEVPGVTRAWCYPLYNGLGTVGLTFVLDGEADPIPDAAKVAEVQAHIDGLRPVMRLDGFSAFAPMPVEIDFEITITPDTAAVREAVQLELADYLTRVAEPGATLYRSQMREAVSVAAGEVDHELTAPAANVALESYEYPVLGTITFGGA